MIISSLGISCSCFSSSFHFLPSILSFSSCSSLYNLDLNYMCSKYFLPVCGLSFYIIYGVWSAQKFLLLIQSNNFFLHGMCLHSLILEIFPYLKSFFHCFCRFKGFPPHLACQSSRNLFLCITWGRDLIYFFEVDNQKLVSKCHSQQVYMVVCRWGGRVICIRECLLVVFISFQLCSFKTKQISPGWCGSVDWVPACEPGGHQFCSQSRHIPELQTRSPLGDV